MKLSKAEKRVIAWISEEWDSDWIFESVMDMDGAISFKVSRATIESLVEKGILFSVSEMHESHQGLEFYAKFNPVSVLEAYTGVEFTKLVDPNGKALMVFS